jgi:CheY-like chemotaxis protein
MNAEFIQAPAESPPARCLRWQGCASSWWMTKPTRGRLFPPFSGEAGADVATAASSQAIDLIDRWEPDVLVADIGMPGEDGYALIDKVRARFSDKRDQIPAIALTALARTQDRLKLLSAGYQMHVPKPVEPIELATVVASLTNRLWRF